MVWKILYVNILRKKKLLEFPFSILTPAEKDPPRPTREAPLVEEGDVEREAVNGAGEAAQLGGMSLGKVGQGSP